MIFDWFNDRNEPLFSAQNFTKLPGTDEIISSKATGILAIKIPHGKGDAIIWFRPEQR